MMKRTGPFTRLLAVTGTVLATVPIAGGLLAAIPYLTGASRNFDWMIPAELGLLSIAGGALLLWASLRAHLRRSWAGWANGIMYGGLVVGTLIANVSGLASGAREAEGWPLWLLLGCFALVYAAMVALIAGGFLLCKDLFAHHDMTPAVTA